VAFDFPSSPTVGQQFSPVAGVVYNYNGYGWDLAGAGSIQVRTQVFTASGTYTSTAGLAYAIVEAIGGGGGGAGVLNAGAPQVYGGGGGGSGGYSRRLLTAAQIGASQPITIGAFGAGGAAGNNTGAAGGDTFMGASLGAALCAAKGGSGGAHAAGGGNYCQGGAGGVIAGAVGDFVAGGAPGLPGVWANTGGAFGQGGGGGSSQLGGGAPSPVCVSGSLANGNAATNYGSGGSGGGVMAAAGSAAGGNGSPGIGIVTEYVVVAGAPAAGADGLLTLLRTLDASGLATADFTNLDATYNEYEIHFQNLGCSVANSPLVLTFSTDNGATWIAGSSYFWSMSWTSHISTAPGGTSGASATAINLLTNAFNPPSPSNPKNAYNGVLRFFSLSSSVLAKVVRSDIWGWSDDGYNYNASGTGSNSATTAPVNGLRIFTAGTFRAGTIFRVYGRK
jgi:hypothetical protein